MSELSNKSLAYWILDETVIGPGNPATYADSTGRGNTLSNNGDMANGLGVCSGVTAAFTNGVNTSSLSRASTSDLSRGDVDFEWTGWAYIPTGTTSSGPIICKCGASPAPSDYEIFLDHSGTTATVTWRVRKADNSGNGEITWATGLAKGDWYFIDVYHSAGLNELGISIDNSAFQTISYSGGVRTTSADFAIGINPGSSTYHFNNGRVSNWGLWGSLLTADERIYLGGNVGPLFYPFADMPSLLTDLKVYYAMEEATGSNRVDSVGALVLTSTNGVTQETGEHNFGAGFSAASSQKLTGSHNSAYSVDTATDGFTISFWIYLVGLGGSALMSKSLFAEWFIEQENGSGRLVFYITPNGGATVYSASSEPIPLNTWTHVLVWYVKATGNFYIVSTCSPPSGVNVGTMIVNTPSNGTGDFVIGTEGPATFFNGRIDELAIWHRVLTDNEKEALGYCFCPPDWPFSDLPSVGIAFEAYCARIASGSLYSTATYGTKTYLLITDPTSGEERKVSAALVDLDGAQPGDKIALKIERDGDDPNDPSTGRCTLELVALDYYTRIQ